MKVTLKLTAACGQTSRVGKVLMSSRMIRSEGREWCDTRQGQSMHSTLDQVKHADFHPVDTHYVLHHEGTV